MNIHDVRRGAFAAALLLGLALGFAVPGAVSSARAEEIEVKIDNFTFAPRTLTVKAGTTVTWINEDDSPHTVVSTGHFRSKPLDTGDRFTFTFTTAGSFQYFCSLHPHMQASITVETTTGGLEQPRANGESQ
jgi:plastocyanin